MAFSAILELPRRFVSFINRLLHGWDTLSEEVGDESAEDSDWSSEDESSSSKRPRTDGGHRKARRPKSRRERKQKDGKGKSKTTDSKEEPTTTPAPSAPVSRLAEVLSSKEGLKSAALKSNARENSSDDINGSKTLEELRTDKDETDSRNATIIKIKPPPPTAPKPRAKRTSSSQSSDTAEDVKSKEKTQNKMLTTTDNGIFDGMEVSQPKLTSYKRTMGPQGRRLPQRYSHQVYSQRLSSQSTNSLAAVSA